MLLLDDSKIPFALDLILQPPNVDIGRSETVSFSNLYHFHWLLALSETYKPRKKDYHCGF